MAIRFSTSAPAGNHFHLGDFTLNVNAPNLAAANLLARFHSPEFDAGLRHIIASNAHRLPLGTPPDTDLHVQVDVSVLSNNMFLVRYGVRICVP